MEGGISILGDAIDFAFDLEDFQKKMRDKWPQTEFRGASRVTACRWQSSSQVPSGFIDATRRHIGIEGERDDCVAFVLWLRAIIPEGVELAIGDDHHGELLPITKETAIDAILRYWQSN